MLIKNKDMSEEKYNLVEKLDKETKERKVFMYAFAVSTGLLVGFFIQYVSIMDIFNIPAF